MHLDIFGKPIEGRNISITIFHDERRFKKEWLYHGLLIVPKACYYEILENLQRHREESGYLEELHFKEITEEKYCNMIILARKWIGYFLNEFYRYGFFYLFGVCLKNIRYDVFGGKGDKRSQKDYRIYNRFFEIALFSALRFFFKDYDLVTIGNIFSHASDRPEEDPFPYHSIYKIKQREVENMKFIIDVVTQISADHQKEKEHANECHFLQFTDNMIGAIAQALDCSSERDCFLELGEMVLALVDGMTRKPYDLRSYYYKRYALSFFPKELLSADEIYSQPRKNMFFQGREIKLGTKGQLKFHF